MALLGIRTLEQGASITVSLRNSSGVVVNTRTLDLPASYFAQMPVNEVVGATAGANSAISFSLTSGSALIYGSGVENDGRSITLQVATATTEM